MHITEDAIDWMRRQCENAGHLPYVRVGVKEVSSCGTHEYFFEYAPEGPSSNDIGYNFGEFSIILSKKDVKFFEKATIILEQEGLNMGLNIINEGEAARCGCGKSVTF